MHKALRRSATPIFGVQSFRGIFPILVYFLQKTRAACSMRTRGKLTIAYLHNFSSKNERKLAAAHHNNHDDDDDDGGGGKFYAKRKRQRPAC